MFTSTEVTLAFSVCLFLMQIFNTLILSGNFIPLWIHLCKKESLAFVTKILSENIDLILTEKRCLSPLRPKSIQKNCYFLAPRKHTLPVNCCLVWSVYVIYVNLTEAFYTFRYQNNKYWIVMKPELDGNLPCATV